MTVQQYLRIATDRWKIIAVCIIVGLGFAAALSLLLPAKYEAGSSIYVSAQTTPDPSQAYQGAQLSEQRVVSYRELVTSDRILRATIEQLSLNEDPTTLRPNIEAASALDSVIIEIRGSARSPSAAAALANSVTEQTIAVIDELERPQFTGQPPPVAVRVVQVALPPERPSSIGLTSLLFLGLVGGLSVGLVAAVLINALDTRVKDPNQASSVADAPLLGVALHHPNYRTDPLVVRAEPQGPQAEAYRQIRTNLNFIEVDSPPKSITISSAVASEGKTTASANLALAQASMGMRVLLIDADLRRPKLAKLLDLDSSVGLTSVLSGRTRLESSIQQWAGGSIEVLASGPTPPNPSELLASRQMRAIIEEAQRYYDYIIVDAAPILPVTDTTALSSATDGVVILVKYGSSRIGQLSASASALRAVGAKILGIAVTMAPESSRRRSAGYYTKPISNTDAPVDGAKIDSPSEALSQKTYRLPVSRPQTRTSTRNPHARADEAGRD